MKKVKTITALLFIGYICTSCSQFTDRPTSFEINDVLIVELRNNEGHFIPVGTTYPANNKETLVVRAIIPEEDALKKTIVFETNKGSFMSNLKFTDTKQIEVTTDTIRVGIDSLPTKLGPLYPPKDDIKMLEAKATLKVGRDTGMLKVLVSIKDTDYVVVDSIELEAVQAKTIKGDDFVRLIGNPIDSFLQTDITAKLNSDVSKGVTVSFKAMHNNISIGEFSGTGTKNIGIGETKTDSDGNVSIQYRVNSNMPNLDKTQPIQIEISANNGQVKDTITLEWP